MGKRLIAILALALIVGLTYGAAYAEVQNVKVSGDITASAILRRHFNLESGSAGDEKNINQSLFMTQTRVRIDADLTDNVMATVRLINERVWNGQNDNVYNADKTAPTNSNNFSIDLDLAFVTLKEFLYSPLTLTIGRQEIGFGNGLIMGNARVPAGVVNIPTDLTMRKAFDAIRATLNYDPLVVDLVYAKINEQDTIRNNDTDLWGINATYDINKKVSVSGYYYLKSDNNPGSYSNSNGKADKVNTIGALVSATPIDNLRLSLEGAFQFGKTDGASDTSTNYNRHKAYAFQAMVDYLLAKVKFTPSIGASYTYLSGNKSATASREDAWDPMFYDQTVGGNISNALLAFTDLSMFTLKGSFKPMEDVTISGLYSYIDMAHEKAGAWVYNSSNRYDGTNRYINSAPIREGKTHLGDELDATIIYDYTEDVQFGLTAGMFLPGKAWDVEKQKATQIIGSMKVTF